MSAFVVDSNMYSCLSLTRKLEEHRGEEKCKIVMIFNLLVECHLVESTSVKYQTY